MLGIQDSTLVGTLYPNPNLVTNINNTKLCLLIRSVEILKIPFTYLLLHQFLIFIKISCSNVGSDSDFAVLFLKWFLSMTTT